MLTNQQAKMWLTATRTEDELKQACIALGLTPHADKVENLTQALVKVATGNPGDPSGINPAALPALPVATPLTLEQQLAATQAQLSQLTGLVGDLVKAQGTPGKKDDRDAITRLRDWWFTIPPQEKKGEEPKTH